jgi:hypothetical protein
MPLLGARLTIAKAAVAAETMLSISERRPGERSERCRGDHWL